MENGEDKKDFTFITETIKEKPISKRKLIIKVLIVIGLGLLFGAVSSVSYIIGVRHAESVLFTAPVEQVVIPDDEETVEEAIDDESLSSDETVSFEDEPEDESAEALENSEASESGDDDSAQVINHINNIVEKVDLSISDYENLYNSLYEIAKEASKSIVNVSCVASDTDWLLDTYESQRVGSGLVIANNKRELLILIDSGILEDAEQIRVELQSGVWVNATVKKHDPNTDLAVISVLISDIDKEILEAIPIARLGRSVGTYILGRKVIAIGSPLGVNGSIAYGIVSSTSELIQLKDTDVHMLSTDIYGSTLASGILVNLRGEVVGIITQDYSDEETPGLITAYGISDIKNTIENLSNGRDAAYLGIYGTDVTEQARQEMNVPLGAYVTEVVMDSPAMDCGIQSGDVITMIGSEEITSFADYKSVMKKVKAGDDTFVTVQRYARGEFAEMTFEVTLGVLK